MLKAIYRSIIVAQTARATSQALNFLSDDQLAGHCQTKRG